MNEDQKEQLNDIQEGVHSSHKDIGVIDERTRNIERQLEEIQDNVDDNSEDIDEIQGKVKRNTTVITGATGGMSMVLIWVSDKLTRFL